MFKAYSNPRYDVVEDEADWLNGLCCIFANALAERFNLPLKALVVRSPVNGSQTLVHAFGSLPEGQMVDARGIRDEQQLFCEDYVDVSEREWRILHGALPTEDIELVVVLVTVGNLWALNPEDLEATNAAHAHLERHADRFRELLAA